MVAIKKPRDTIVANCMSHQLELMNKGKVRPGFAAVMCRSENCWLGIFSNGEITLCSSCFPGFDSDEDCLYECLDPVICECKKCKLMP